MNARESGGPPAVADLIGPGWGRFVGRWLGERRLVGDTGGWTLLERGRERGRWPHLAAALDDLWRDRGVRGPAPWAVGWLSYETAADLAGSLPHRPPDLPAGCLLLEPRAVGGPERPPPRLVDRYRAPARASLDARAFADGVRLIRERIAAGSVYQVNLTRRFTVAAWPGDAAPLLAAVPAPVPDYLSRIRGGGVDLVCASMELLVRRRGRRTWTRPIKGTRPRGATAEADRALARELSADPKERAELAMVVDLERNDLGTVAIPGTVVVTDPGSVASFGGVHHLVATVEAEVEASVPWWRLLTAMAPGGSVTGCPKRAAMGAIAELEPVARGPFTGVLGVVTGDGDLELALPIRTGWVAGGRLEFAAGCGIVWPSDPAREEAESRLKVARWLELVGEPA